LKSSSRLESDSSIHSKHSGIGSHGANKDQSALPAKSGSALAAEVASLGSNGTETKPKNTSSGGESAAAASRVASSLGSMRRNRRISSLKQAAQAVRIASRAQKAVSSMKKSRETSSTGSSKLASMVSILHARQATKRPTSYYVYKFLRRTWRAVRGTIIGLRD